MFSKSLTCLAAAALLGHAKAVPPPCQDMTFTLTVTANTIVLPPLPDISHPNDVLGYIAQLPSNLPHTDTTGTYNISATYCAPNGVSPDQVQLLVHGSSYTKKYWMGGAWDGPNVNSWAKYANNNGFATLAVDLLGNGLSSHPDPLQEVQLPMDVEILKLIAQKIKNGDITGMPSKVIYVGHSMGSGVGTMLAATYPDSIDKLVLTGYTINPTNAFVIAANTGAYIPAKDADPARFGDLLPGYVTQSGLEGRIGLSYAGNYDPSIPPLDFATRGTTTVGEAIGLGTVPVPNYRGPVFVATGDLDGPFCGTDPNVSCEHIIQATAGNFPGASQFRYFMPSNTGHALPFHRSAHQSFEAVTDWLLHGSNNP